MIYVKRVVARPVASPAVRSRRGQVRRKFHNVPAYYHNRLFHQQCQDQAQRDACPVCTGLNYDREHWYVSTAEARYAQHCDLLCKAGELVDWERPKSIVLSTESCPKCNALSGAVCADPHGRAMAGFHGARIVTRIVPDFYVIPAVGFGRYVDVKAPPPKPRKDGTVRRATGVTETREFKRKVKLWRQKIPHELRVAYLRGDRWEERVLIEGNEATKYKISQERLA